MKFIRAKRFYIHKTGPSTGCLIQTATSPGEMPWKLNKIRFDCFWWYMYTHIIVCRESIVQLIKIQFISKVYPWGRIQLLNSQVLSSRGLKRPFVGHSMPILKRHRHGFTRQIRRSQDLRAFAGSCAWVALAAQRIQNQNKINEFEPVITDSSSRSYLDQFK